MWGRRTSLAPQRPMLWHPDPSMPPAIDFRSLAGDTSHEDLFRKARAVDTAFRKPSHETTSGEDRSQLAGVRARVKGYLDLSPSMWFNDRRYYDLARNCDGVVTCVMQELVTRMMPLAMRLDSNGLLELYLFSNELYGPFNVGLEPGTYRGEPVYGYSDLVQRHILPHIWNLENGRIVNRQGRPGQGQFVSNGTNYTAVLDDLIATARSMDPQEWLMGLIMSDGDPNEPEEAIERTCKYSQYAGSVKAVGVNEVDFLVVMDDLEKRRPGTTRLFDNWDSKVFSGQHDSLPNIRHATDEQVAEALVCEQAKAIAGALSAGVLRAA